MKIYEEGDLKYVEMIKPSNFHVHWREQSQLPFLVPHTSRQFYYAMGMPNLTKPLVRVGDAVDYC